MQARHFPSFLMLSLPLLVSACLHSPVQEAVILGHIQSSDSLEVKIDKALALLNERGYFQDQTKSSLISPATTNSLSYEKTYERDSLRTPDEILAQKQGGSSGSSALAFAAILKESQVDEAKIQIVPAVINSELKISEDSIGWPL